MTAAAADALRMLAPSTPDEWPVGILAAADLRQARAEAAIPGPYYVVVNDLIGGRMIRNVPDPPSTNKGRDVGDFIRDADAEHIAAEANPAHALAAVDRWLGAAHRHRPLPADPRICNNGCPGRYPCDDLAEVSDEARAYLGEPS